jgi:diguanylate cyclase (GGDEF)-like protein/PAS domain S-box-containing protein
MDAPARDHEDLLALLGAGVEDSAIMLLDADGHVRTWNERAPQLEGYRAGEIVGRHVSVFYPPEDIEAGKPERELSAAAVKGHLENEGWRVLKDGTQVWANVVITALREPDGTLRGFGTIMRDLTERRAHERAIVEREQLLTGVLAASTEYAITGTDLDGTITIFNTGAERMLGYRAEEMVGLRTPAVFHDPDEVAARAEELGIPPGLEVFVGAARRLEPETRQWTYLRKDGSRLTVQLTLTALLDGNGRPRGFIGIAADVSERRRSEDALRVADERFRHAFDDAPIGLAIIAATPNALGRYLDVNKAMCELTGYDRERLLGMTYQSLTHPGDADRDVVRARRLVNGTIERHLGEKRYIHASGRVIEASVGASLIRDESGQPLHIIAHIEDVSDRKRYETQLQYMANHDPLTGLFNRARLNEALDAHVRRVQRYGAVGALLLIDLDQFKSVNDRLGHNVGDGLLISVARIMQSRTRDTDVLTRLGGDEFALLMTEGGETEAQILAGDLSDLIRRRSVVLEGGMPGGITASIGIAVFDERDGLRADDILAEADSAMYTAKHGGRDRIAAYVTEDGVRHQSAARLTLHHEIDAALKDDRFELRLQPVMDLRSGKIGKYEVLLRMIGEDGTVIPPATFLYVAERFDQIHAIDRWVIEHAVSVLGQLPLEQSIEINLSARSLGDPGLVSHIGDVIAVCAVDPDRLIFELTETTAIENIHRASEFVDGLTALGCHFALDDFGAGFGSFYYLKYLPFDYLKIDGEFVKNCTESRIDQLIIQSCVQLARGLGKQTIAEFVENAEILRLVRALGVDHAQGYEIARPLSVDQVLAKVLLP